MLKSPQFTRAPLLVGSSEQDTAMLMGTKGAEGRGNIAYLVQLALFLLVQPRTWFYFVGDSGLETSRSPYNHNSQVFPKSLSQYFMSRCSQENRLDLSLFAVCPGKKTWILKLKYCERHRKKHPVFFRFFFFLVGYQWKTQHWKAMFHQWDFTKTVIPQRVTESDWESEQKNHCVVVWIW